MKKKLKNQIMDANPWWDYSNLLTLMEVWLRNSSHKHKTKGNLLSSDKTSKEMLIAAELIKRIKADEYYKPNKVFNSKNVHIEAGSMGLGLDDFSYSNNADQRKQDDLTYLMDLMKKHLLGWWD